MSLALFRRRRVWLPTIWGTLLLFAALAVACFAFALSAYDLLAPQQPARGPDGTGARTLVVEGWLERDELQQAIGTARRGRYARVVTTGGPLDPWFDASGWGSFAQRGAAYLRANGLTDVPVIAVPAPQTRLERTWLSAVTVREWAQRSGTPLDAIDLYSAGAHTRRSWLVYRMAFGAHVEVGVLAAEPTDFDARRWWTSSAGAKAVLGETLGLAWTKCCFWPDDAAK